MWRRSKGGALALREQARRRAWSLRLVVEKWCRPSEPADPPAKHHGRAASEDPERRRRSRIRRERPDGGAFEDAAERQAEDLVSGTTVGLVVHERMNDGDDREARSCGGVGDRSPTTIRVPPKDLVGERQTPHRIHASGDPHAPGRHLEDVRSAGGVEHVRTSDETSERLTVLAVADEAEAGRRRDAARDTTHATALAPKRDVRGH